MPEVLSKFKTGTGVPLLKYHQILLRGPSPFSVAERELMAAFVSRVNDCDYCAGSHAAVAEIFGMPEGLLSDLVENLVGADVDPKMRPVLSYIRKLTETPSRMIQADADVVFAAGWDERALYDAIQVCCLYNFMNRFVDGIGLAATPDLYAPWGKMIKETGYDGMPDEFGIE